MKSFSQRDSQWNNAPLGSSNYTLGRFGCTTTCIADLSTYFGDNLNPLQVSQKLKYINGLVLWVSAKFNNFIFDNREYGRNNANIKGAIQDPDKAVLIQVNNGAHWVVAIGYTFFGKLKIADPWFGDFTTIGRYQNNITGATYFKKTVVQLPKVPLKIAFLGLQMPLEDDFKAQVAYYSQNKISCAINRYSVNYTGTLTQDQAYTLVDSIKPLEKFIFIFYQGVPSSVFYATYYYPARNCYITTCPQLDPRLLTYELGHQLIKMYNDNRGNNPHIEDEDSNFPSDNAIKEKFDAISKYYL